MSLDEELANVIKEWGKAWESMDVDGAARLDEGAVGYGFRTKKWRDGTISKANEHQQGIKRFLDGMEKWHTEFIELHTRVDGDIGLAWGTHIEEYIPKGKPAEVARVRFTFTLKRTGKNWRIILYHRGIQPFDDSGLYMTKFTRAL